MGKSASSKKQKAKSPEPVRDPPRESSKSPLLLTPLISVAVGIVCFFGGMYYGRQEFSGPVSDNLYTVYVKSGKTHHLTHVLTTLQEAEYTRVEFNQTMNWKLMWAHDYPFVALKDKMMNLRHGQRVNKFPGTGYITNKVYLATSNIANVPPAFQIPKDKHKALAFAKEFPEKMFVIKNNDHRGVRVDKVENMNLDDAGVFVQEFVHNPLLVDGYKFDVGLYVVLTSVDPLRLYVYDEDILVRFCSEKYHPFDSSKTKQYVVFDDYLPSWELPSLAPYLENESTFQEAIKSYMRSLNKDPEEMWRQMHRTILDVYTRNEDNFIHTVNQFPHKESSYFEMVRFDFVLDENLNVYLMEVNMSPNLSSVHFPRNAKLYLKVVHGLEVTNIGAWIDESSRSPEQVRREAWPL